MIRHRARHVVAAMIPVAVPSTMAAVFGGLRRCMSSPAAYNSGFAIYWLGWCLAVPLWLLGPREAVRLLATGRPLPRSLLLPLALPVTGAVATQLIPHRREVDVPTAAIMAGTAAVNAVGEELLWRAVFMREFDRHPSLAMLWSLIGFSAWHFAPQIILPSRLGRGRFVAGSAVVGIASTVTVWNSGGLRQVVVAHAVTDLCGVTAARFRLGRQFRETRARSV